MKENQDDKNYLDQLSENERLEYNKNVGIALEALRRQLPYVFATSSLDFSIFAQQITLQDEKTWYEIIDCTGRSLRRKSSKEIVSHPSTVKIKRTIIFSFTAV